MQLLDLTAAVLRLPDWSVLVVSVYVGGQNGEEYLASIGYESFAFTHFPLPRFGHDTANIVESTNSAWREIRELPLFSFLMGYINGVLQHGIKYYS